MHSGAYQERIYSAKNESHVASPTLYDKIKTCHLRLPPKPILMANFRREINMFTPLYRKQFWYPYSSYYSLFEKIKQNRLKGSKLAFLGGLTVLTGMGTCVIHSDRFSY